MFILGWSPNRAQLWEYVLIWSQCCCANRWYRTKFRFNRFSLRKSHGLSFVHHLQKQHIVPWASPTAAGLWEWGMVRNIRNDVLVCRLVQTPPSNLMRDRMLLLSISLKTEGFPYLNCSLDKRQARTMLKIVDVFKRSSDSAKVALIYGEPHTNPTKLASHLAMSLRQQGIWSAATYCSLQVQRHALISGKSKCEANTHTQSCTLIQMLSCAKSK